MIDLSKIIELISGWGEGESDALMELLVVSIDLAAAQCSKNVYLIS